jgi:predicted nucleotidyltransferase component of viral defense system
VIKNLPASIHQRLLNKAKAERRPFGEVLQYYAMERFLYRLSRSAHGDRFVLKGALMLRVWRSPQSRPTMDIDLLGRTSNAQADIVSQVKAILSTEVEPDGITFDATSIQAEGITEDADYAGIRIRFRGTLGTAHVHMQLDIGFGDIVFPEPESLTFPALLDLPAPSLLGYTRESAIAEKFEAMVKLGELNSRMKDFYDIWLLSRRFDFESAKLAEAIRRTFEHRQTKLPPDIAAFSDEFIVAKQAQWVAFTRRLGDETVPTDFAAIGLAVKSFLLPIVMALRTGESMTEQWTAPGPWT